MAKLYSEIDERTNLAGSNKFEMLIFRLGKDKVMGQSELFGINVFKLREIMAMPKITSIAGADKFSLGVLNLRGQVIPVFDLTAIVGCAPDTQSREPLKTYPHALTPRMTRIQSGHDHPT